MLQSYCSFAAHTHVIQNGFADPNIRPQASMRLILLRTPSKSSAQKKGCGGDTALKTGNELHELHCTGVAGDL